MSNYLDRLLLLQLLLYSLVQPTLQTHPVPEHSETRPSQSLVDKQCCKAVLMGMIRVKVEVLSEVEHTDHMVKPLELDMSVDYQAGVDIDRHRHY